MSLPAFFTVFEVALHLYRFIRRQRPACKVGPNLSGKMFHLYQSRSWLSSMTISSFLQHKSRFGPKKI
jgi:hypothetical protein